MESTGLHWLAQAAPDPDAFREQWERSGLGLMLLPAGRRWDVLSVPGRLGRPVLDILDSRSCGPVLSDFTGESIGFLVPVGTAARWIGTGVRCAGDGTWIVVPHPERRSRGVRWLIPPDGSGRLNDPVLLELALHEAAARLSDW
ncbi:hypothetical protein [Kitasatospora sp. NPDC050463]|uniref:hypothetical protein n=1 Tax=Kitasatospora sp. NPDC050463 TaxID=3155786 RepID=UPI0033E2DC14